MNTTTIAPTFTLGERLRKARQEHGLDQAQLSAILGLARNTLSAYETERSAPSFSVVVSWAHECGVSLEWLAEGVPLETQKAPAINDESLSVRPKGFEPLAFWSVVCDEMPRTIDELLSWWPEHQPASIDN